MSDTTTNMSLDFLAELGMEGTSLGACWGEWVETGGERELVSVSPTDETEIGRVKMATADDYEHVMAKAGAASLGISSPSLGNS